MGGGSLLLILELEVRGTPEFINSRWLPVHLAGGISDQKGCRVPRQPLFLLGF